MESPLLDRFGPRKSKNGDGQTVESADQTWTEDAGRRFIALAVTNMFLPDRDRNRNVETIKRAEQGEGE